MYIYQIIHQVQEKYRGLAVRLSEKSGKSVEWHRSHGYPPQTLDPFGNGKKCAEVEDFFDFAERYEAGVKGAGLMLARLVYAELKCRFTSNESNDCTQRELRHIGLKEATEAIQAIDKCDFEKATDNDFDEMTRELVELGEFVERGIERVRRERDKKEVRHSFTNR